MMSIKINEVKTMNLNRSHMNGSSSIIEKLYDVKLKTPADPKHEIDKSYTYGKLFFL